MVAKLPGLAAADVDAILKVVGMTLVSTVGGASGPLYGTFFLQLASTTAGKSSLDLEAWRGAWQAGVAGVVRRGKAAPSDKTMLDALVPAVAVLD